MVAQYLLFHYGTEEHQLPYADGPHTALNFPVRCVTECLDRAGLPPQARALDLGCSVGRSAFELSRCFPEVVAVDFSQAFIQAAQIIQSRGSVTCQIPVEGSQTQEVELHLPLGLIKERVDFLVGDALKPSADWGTFDCILAANLLDRVPDPLRLLTVLTGLTRPGGQLILTSPYTWLEAFTPRPNWPEETTFNFLQTNLRSNFDLQRRCDLPFLIREHARKYQWSLAEATVWRKI